MAEGFVTNMKKPGAAFIAGVTAPPGKRMGHAGAIITGGKGKAEDKVRTLNECGVVVTQSPTRMGAAMQEALKRKQALPEEGKTKRGPRWQPPLYFRMRAVAKKPA